MKAFNPQVKSLTSAQNPLLKMVTSLQEKKYRKKYQLFLIEGKRLLAQAVKAEFALKYLFFAEDFPELLLLNQLLALSEDAYKLPPAILNRLSAVSTCQGLVGVALLPSAPDPQKEKPEGIYLLLEEVNDPGNLGAVIRVGWAGGAQALILAGECVDPYDPKVVRASAGGIFKLPIFSFPQKESALKFLTAKKIKIYATLPHLPPLPQEGKAYQLADYQEPLALCFGSEAWGLSEAFLNNAGEKITIPLQGGAESLNLAVSCGILLYAVKLSISCREQ